MKGNFEKMNIKSVSNAFGDPFLEKDQMENEQKTIYTYALYLLVPSEPPLRYFLKKIIHSDILEARRIASHLFKNEKEWLKVQPENQIKERSGVVLVFQPIPIGDNNLIVESNLEIHASVTEQDREKEKKIFEVLGLEYPERNFNNQ